LVSQCMDFCHALASHHKVFTFSLTIGSTFAFFLDTRENLTPAANVLYHTKPVSMSKLGPADSVEKKMT